MTNFVPETRQFRSVRGWMEDGNDLRQLLLAEETLADTCLRLARQLPGQAAALQGIARDARGHVACLEGICVLVTGEVPDIRTPVPEVGAALPTLRRCYGTAMRTLVTYEARGADREYGPVFNRLAAQQRDQCRNILTIISAAGK